MINSANSLGGLNKLKLNLQGTNDVVRSNSDKLINNEYNMKTVISLLTDIKSDMKEFTYHMMMDTVDLSMYFPLKSDDDLSKFMNRNDDEWELRKKGFYHLLFTAVTKSRRKFAAALLHALFSREFIKNHRWPG